jgi:Rrf2 family protein
MRISNRADYACFVVLDLAQNWAGEKPVPLRRLSTRKRLPYKYLTQILLQLKAAGLVRSLRGAGGGYRLSRPPATISIWDVISAVQSDEEGPTRKEPGNGDRFSLPDYCVLRGVWESLAEIERKYLEKKNFEDLVRTLERNPQPMFYL